MDDSITVNESGNPQKAVDLMYKQSVNGLKQSGINLNFNMR